MLLAVLGLAVGATSYTLTRSSMPGLKYLRERCQAWSPTLGELLHCPYCCSHWVALAICAAYRPRFITSDWLVVDLFTSWMAVVGAAMVPIFMLMYINRSV